LKVLFVDDDVTCRLVMGEVFKEVFPSVELIIANDGNPALGILEQHDRFDLIICDYHMLDMNGIDLFKTIMGTNDLRYLQHKDVPFIMLSSTTVVEDALSFGIANWFVKGSGITRTLVENFRKYLPPIKANIKDVIDFGVDGG